MSEGNVAIVRDSLEHVAATDEFLNVIALDQVHDCGDDRVLALLEQSGRPHGSGIEVYASFDEALQAAGVAG